MNTPFRRVILGILAVLGLFVGAWAYGFPAAFYSSFPGLGLHWIDISGAYDEHLIRDVGSLYLALTAITIPAILSRTASAGRLAGLGWTVFGALHFLFHVTHPEGTITDLIGNNVSLLLSLALGVIALSSGRRAASTETAA